MLQILTKAIILVFYLVPTGWALLLALLFSYRVVRSEFVTLAWLNPFRLSADQLRQASFAPDAIYQDGMIVARLRGEPEVDRENRRVTFPSLIRTENLELKRPFVFRQWRLEMEGVPQSIGAYAAGDLLEHTGRALGGVRCRIVGSSAF